MVTLTIFTPTYNRAHTLVRTYESLCNQTCKDFEWLIIDDGSTDNTRKWVESLGEKTVAIGQGFDWMGRTMNNIDDNNFIISLPNFNLRYIYKPNGGLYTGYNVAYATIKSELCVCIDSDDYAEYNLVEKVITVWNERDTTQDICGIVGLDFNVITKNPIGGYFKGDNLVCNYFEIKHNGDTKEVLRTDLLKSVAPQIGFEGEKDFNPFYMLSQVLDKYPIIVENSNFCWVEYQSGNDSMSQAIFKQYKRSPRSYAKYRLNEFQLTHNRNWTNDFISCAHYVSACIFSKDTQWLSKSPKKLMTLLALPLGCILNLYIRYKAK